ncbi:MAG TPA: septum formation initiator family protein [Chitinophagaceae bacterium]|nr:septum formation initiator family protein [Chitinophagaceae bacterium]
MKYFAFLKNKFFIVTIVFIVWVTFFAQYDILSVKNQRQELNEMKEKIEYLHQEVEKQQNEKQLLENDSNTVERYAREKYFMKKDNEDIYMIDTLTKPEK